MARSHGPINGSSERLGVNASAQLLISTEKAGRRHVSPWLTVEGLRQDSFCCHPVRLLSLCHVNDVITLAALCG